mmetsp:Transcript_3521/g.9691  ORF Transcript_3521/g.9691 Transcript_3521/m.9691 type:complete len:313 (+) Transcript_3521:1398-2336(+)
MRYGRSCCSIISIPSITNAAEHIITIHPFITSDTLSSRAWCANAEDSVCQKNRLRWQGKVKQQNKTHPNAFNVELGVIAHLKRAAGSSRRVGEEHELRAGVSQCVYRSFNRKPPSGMLTAMVPSCAISCAKKLVHSAAVLGCSAPAARCSIRGSTTRHLSSAPPLLPLAPPASIIRFLCTTPILGTRSRTHTYSPAVTLGSTCAPRSGAITNAQPAPAPPLPAAAAAAAVAVPRASVSSSASSTRNARNPRQPPDRASLSARITRSFAMNRRASTSNAASHAATTSSASLSLRAPPASTARSPSPSPSRINA